MYEEAGRLMADHFHAEDMAGVDWEAARARYRPLVERVATRDDLSEVIWELHGELGASHAYERPPDRPVEAEERLGLLGADLARDGTGRLVLARVLPGESSVPDARSPLAAPGVALRPGDALLAVDGRPVDPAAGVGPLLVGAAGRPVELTVARAPAEPAAGSASASATGPEQKVVVVPLADERPLRYQDWVRGRRGLVHSSSGGRVGYLHVPDMVGSGWAQLHRDLHLEVRREALVVDVRDNSGGHVSELVIEKLARTVRGWDLARHREPQTYPSDVPRGPLVAVVNEQAGSDGDIVTAAFQLNGLGPVVGKRTWGGVIGIDSAYDLVDGSAIDPAPVRLLVHRRLRLGCREPRGRPGRRGRARPAGLGRRSGPPARAGGRPGPRGAGAATGGDPAGALDPSLAGGPAPPAPAGAELAAARWRSTARLDGRLDPYGSVRSRTAGR